MNRIWKIRAKIKIQVKNLISNKVMDIAEKVADKIQNKPTPMDNENNNEEILMFDDGFFNLMNSKNISKI